MEIIGNSSVLIASKRHGEMLANIGLRIQSRFGEKTKVGLSAVSIVELTHSIHKAQTLSHRERRREFAEEPCRDIAVHPVILAIAQLARRMEGQAAKGIIIAFQHLVIEATALYVGFDVATLNVRPFQQTPSCNVVML